MPDTTLHISISGLCLLARDHSNQAKPMVHVLTPATGHKAMMDAPHVHQHSAEWLIDLGYFGGGTVTDFYVRVPFGGIFDLSNLATSAGPASLGNAVPSITDILKHKVKPTLLGELDATSRLPDEATGRLTFAHGSDTAYVKGLCYDFESHLVSMPPAIQWTIDRISQWPPANIVDPLNLMSQLKPIGNEVVLHLFHVPSEEMPKKPSDAPTSTDKPVRPPHYVAYYNLFDITSQPETRLPKVHAGSCDQSADHEYHLLGPNPYTCMLGGGDGP